MNRVKRRYIALISTVVLFLFFVLRYFAQENNYSPNQSVKNYFEYVLLFLQAVLTFIVFRSKKDDTKNVLTTLIVLITLLYMTVFFYNVAMN